MQEGDMGRTEKRRDLVQAIVDASRDLFVTQGYRETTIRQIIDRVGIKNGSLYHFFRDKEDILCHVSLKTYHEFIAHVDGVTEGEDGHVKYAMTRALEFRIIEESDSIARLYEETYSSWRVSEAMMPINMERNRLFFHGFNPTFTEDDYRNRTLALRGIRLLLITDRVRSGPGRFPTWAPFAIETALSVFNVPKNDIDRSVAKAMDFVSTHDIPVLLEG
jgi:AcrR family transcriptional regulator